MKYIYVLLASLAIVSCQKKRRIAVLMTKQVVMTYENGDGKTKSC
jgi:uncharacterized protein YcfL